MPYVAGGELFHHLRKYPIFLPSLSPRHHCHVRATLIIVRSNTFDENVARFYTAEIVLALEHVHSKNICYRDLKVRFSQVNFSSFTNY